MHKVVAGGGCGREVSSGGSDMRPSGGNELSTSSCTAREDPVVAAARLRGGDARSGGDDELHIAGAGAGRAWVASCRLRRSSWTRTPQSRLRLGHLGCVLDVVGLKDSKSSESDKLSVEGAIRRALEASK
uniref:Uncharacterized protein n=1 Tax=Oryza punctata TaxID=4537 RepID=A0A0E0KIQ5_ORYPU